MHCRPPLGEVPLVYVAGPYRSSDPNPNIRQSKVVANIRLAEDVGYEVYKLGAVPVIPHKMFALWDYRFDIDDRTILDYTLAVMERCDAVLMIPGWKHSEGSRGELKRAKEIGLAVFFNLEKLDEWLAKVM